MEPMLQTTSNTSRKEKPDSHASAANILYNELEKGIRSMKNDDVYTIEQAWREIDKV